MYYTERPGFDFRNKQTVGSSPEPFPIIFQLRLARNETRRIIGNPAGYPRKTLAIGLQTVGKVSEREQKEEG